MLDRQQHRAPTEPSRAERAKMMGSSEAEHERALRFRNAALPHLDDVFALARYLMRDVADAEDAVQECYLRALRHFDSYHGPSMKQWLLAILRNVCNSEFARRSKKELRADDANGKQTAEAAPVWQEVQDSPETVLVREQSSAAVRRLIAELPQPFREVFVLREVNELSYHQIADVCSVPVGTVMSRLARARSMLRSAWAEEEKS